jgi:hypothetical protein
MFGNDQGYMRTTTCNYWIGSNNMVVAMATVAMATQTPTGEA